MKHYKFDKFQVSPNQRKKLWMMQGDNTENQRLNFICPSSQSYYFEKIMESGASPLNEIQNNFGEDIPIFNDSFFRVLDHFTLNQNDEGLQILEFLLCKNIANTSNFYGKYSISIIINSFPKSFQILADLLSQPLSTMANTEFYSSDCQKKFFSNLIPFIEDPDYHLILSIILQSIKPLNFEKAIIPSFFDACNHLLSSLDKEVIANILYGCQNNFFGGFEQELSQLISQNIEHLLSLTESEIDQNDAELNDAIIQFSLLSLSKIIKDDTIETIFGCGDIIFHLIYDSLSSINQMTVYSASELVSSLVSFKQAYEILTSPDFIDKIFELASDSPYLIRDNMISTLCDLIYNQNTEQNLIFLSKGILDLLIDFLNNDQNANAYEAVKAILYLLESSERTDQNDYVINTIMENKFSFQQLEDRQIKSISETVEIIFNKIFSQEDIDIESNIEEEEEYNENGESHAFIEDQEF